jgi:hypothetical protein
MALTTIETTPLTAICANCGRIRMEHHVVAVGEATLYICHDAVFKPKAPEIPRKPIL